MGRPREHDEVTRVALLDAAEVLIAGGGLEAVSVRAVARRSAVPSAPSTAFSVRRRGLFDYRRKHVKVERLGVTEQTRVLADLYSRRAEAYDALWSPVIRPMAGPLLEALPLSKAKTVLDVGTGAGALLPAIRRSAPRATIIGVDVAEGMLRLAQQHHNELLAVMDVQNLAFLSESFDVVIAAFVLFHLPSPFRGLSEIRRVLRPGGKVGMVTWAPEFDPPAESVWDEELERSGATAVSLPALDNKKLLDSSDKCTAILRRAGFVGVRSWTQSFEYRWTPRDHFDYHVRWAAQFRLSSLDPNRRRACLARIRRRLARLGPDGYLYTPELVFATAGAPRRNR